MSDVVTGPAARAATVPAAMTVAMTVAMTAVGSAVVLGVAGAGAGAATRVLLGRLHRGTQVAPPWCELVLALLWATTGGAWAAGVLPAAWLPALLGLGWFGVAAGTVDLRRGRLPDALTLPALPAAWVFLVPLGPSAVARGVAGALLAVAVHAAVHLADRRAMGAGDVKLAAPLGAVLAAAAWSALPLAAVLAAVFTVALHTAAAGTAPSTAATAGTSTAGVTTTGMTRAGACTVRLGTRATVVGRRRRGVPHGPSMLVATFLVTTWLVAVGSAGDGAGE